MPFFKKKNNKIKKYKTHSLLANLILSPPIDKIPFKRVSLWIASILSKKNKKASMTIESAFVMPLFFLAMVTLMCFMNVVKNQVEQTVELTQKAKWIGVQAYLGESQMSKDEIKLLTVHQYSFPVSIARTPSITYVCKSIVKPWIGYQQGEVEEEIQEEMVYITENQSVYHTSASCTHLNLSIMAVPKDDVKNMRNDYGGKYYCCEKCGESLGGCVYITENGNKYHSQSGCSGLKRTVMLVPKSSVGGLSVCSRCG